VLDILTITHEVERLHKHFFLLRAVPTVHFDTGLNLVVVFLIYECVWSMLSSLKCQHWLYRGKAHRVVAASTPCSLAQ